MFGHNLFNDILVIPILNLLVAIYHVLSFAHIPYTLGFSIIVLTIAIRLVLYPLINSQLKASKKMQEVAPHINKLKEKHKNDAKMLQQETMRVYKEFGINPAAGCLPVLIQLPIIWGLYAVLQQIVKADLAAVLKGVNQVVYFDALKLQKPWDPNFFGLPLGHNPSQLMSSVGFIVLLIPVITALLQFIQTKMMIMPMPKEEQKDGKKKNDDFATAFQSQSAILFPLMIGFFSFTFPVGLSLYWNTFTIFGIIQQYKISGLGGLEEYIKKVYGRK